MTTYTVTWSLSVLAPNPEAAVHQARAIMMDSQAGFATFGATFFTVEDEQGNKITKDFYEDLIRPITDFEPDFE